MAKKKAAKKPQAPALPPNNLAVLQQKLGHNFVNPNILWEALQAAGNGVVKIDQRKIDDGNKKLALIGDSILQLAVLDDWFRTGSSRKIGSDILCSVGNNWNLAKCGRDNKLSDFIVPNPSFTKGEIPPKTMSATVEALIGAVFLDSGESLMAVKGAMRGLGLL